MHERNRSVHLALDHDSLLAIRLGLDAILIDAVLAREDPDDLQGYAGVRRGDLEGASPAARHVSS